jgi:hypothetical protein
MVLLGPVKVEYCKTADMVADAVTKRVELSVLHRCMASMGVGPSPHGEQA